MFIYTLYKNPLTIGQTSVILLRYLHLWIRCRHRQPNEVQRFQISQTCLPARLLIHRHVIRLTQYQASGQRQAPMTPPGGHHHEKA